MKKSTGAPSEGFLPGKLFRTYEEQVELLESRGMVVEDAGWAIKVLRRVSYYRLSGYWYSFREFKLDGSGRGDTFKAGTTFGDVLALYDFDVRLRAAVFTSLAPIELSIRALLGHELGRIDPQVHFRPELLGPTARKSGTATASSRFTNWSQKYENELNRSQEDFVKHHRERYGGQLPVWVAVEILDWGKMTHLYGLSPNAVRDAIAAEVDLTAAQLDSWLKSLNIVRNYAAHHGRMFNRVYALKPKLPESGRKPELASLESLKNRTFAQLALIQFLLTQLKVGDSRLIPAVMRSYPDVKIVPISRMGVPNGWNTHPLFA